MRRTQAAGGLEQDKLLVPRFGIHPEVAEDPLPPSQKQSPRQGVSGNVVEKGGGQLSVPEISGD